MSNIQFKYTILYVKDVTTTIEFYEKAFGFERIFITPENDYGELNTGGTTLSFASIELANSNLDKGFVLPKIGDQPFGIELAFTTDNVEETVQKAIDNGASIYQSPKVKPWGQTVGYITDPNGFLLEICTPINS